MIKATGEIAGSGAQLYGHTSGVGVPVFLLFKFNIILFSFLPMASLAPYHSEITIECERKSHLETLSSLYIALSADIF